MLRSNTCGELTKKDVKKKVTLCGWSRSRRDHGGVIFIDLVDRYGITQVVFDPSHNKEVHNIAERVGNEWVILVKGAVRPRPSGMINPKLTTGEIEIIVDRIEILNKSEVTPIQVDDHVTANEDVRLKYRYLDLRRPVMQKHIETRHKAAQAVREYFNDNKFLEIETPLLIRSTPEGARDYVVPSRVNPGKFYSLPQSPQLYKQILMISGMDRYYQITKCLRDEDLRADRQPEFTQIDVEMSFVDEEDIQKMTEGMLKHVFKKAVGLEIKTPFPKITYHDAMERYGSDKPDTRFDLELIPVEDIVKDSDFMVFKQVLDKKGTVKCINAKGCAKFSRKEIDELISFAQSLGAKGMAWIKMEDKLESSIIKYLNDDIQKKLIAKTKAKKGDLLLFIADEHFTTNTVLGNIRLKLAEKLNLIKGGFSFVWVTDFPLVEYDETEQKHVAVHHPFTSPKDPAMFEKDPKNAIAKAYDVTLNGIEIGGGSIRTHDPKIQEKVLGVLGIDKKEANDKFGFLLEALSYGAPPHGGIAMGFDRMVALLCGFNDIREVMAFPKNKKAENPMDGCPSPVDDKQLKELNIKTNILKK
ncbi:MAG: aspartate--tRNA ligase [bacterium]|nr:aspartate--tRNA ligase [bacterium]